MNLTYDNNYLNYLNNPNYNIITNGLILNFRLVDNINSYTNHNITSFINPVYTNSSINLNNNYLKIINNIDSYQNTSYTLTFWFHINDNNNITILTEDNTKTDIISIIDSNLIIMNNVIHDITKEKWHNIGLIFKDTDECNLYLDCVYITKITNISASIFNNYMNLILNNSKSNVNYFDFKIYNRTLEDYEIQQIFGLSIVMKTGYIFNNQHSRLTIDVNNISQYLFDTYSFSVSFNIKFFDINFTYINIIYITNILKISLKYINNNYYIELYHYQNNYYYPINLNANISYNIILTSAYDYEYSRVCYINNIIIPNVIINNYIDVLNMVFLL